MYVFLQNRQVRCPTKAYLLHFAYDNELNLYFRTKIDTRHSLEVKENPYVAGNIVTQHGNKDKPRGVYFEGTCKIVEDDPELTAAVDSYSERFDIERESLSDKIKDEVHRLYKITVNKFYVFDARESSPSQKYELEWNK